MRGILLAALACVCAFVFSATAADAHARHHHYHQQVQAAPIFTFNFFSPVNAAPTPAQHHWRHYAAKHSKTVHGDFDAIGHAGLVTVQTAAGIPITVAQALAPRFQAMISDFVAAGYRPHAIGCFARGGHVVHSRHYAGAACDFDQTGWGKTAKFMYSERAHEIIVAHGFRDGREFRDQGHVDDGFALAGYYHRHYARHHYRHYAKG